VVLVFTTTNTILLGSYYAFNLSAPELLQRATGLDTSMIGYVVAAGGLLGGVVMIAFGWHSDRRQERFFHLALPLATSALAYGTLALTHDPRVTIAAYWLAIASNAAIAATFSLVPGELMAARSMAISIAFINSVGQLGSFVSPILWGMAKDATGDYRLALSFMPIGFLLAASMVLWLRHHMGFHRTALAAESV
jgi:ACS family tartrate transporter-like MFS transporter